MFARFDENPAMTLQDIKETKRYGRRHTRMDNVKTVYPPQTKFAGGIKIQLTIVNNMLPISFNMFLGAQKNCLFETVLLSTRNICFG